MSRGLVVGTPRVTAGCMNVQFLTEWLLQRGFELDSSVLWSWLVAASSQQVHDAAQLLQLGDLHAPGQISTGMTTVEQQQQYTSEQYHTTGLQPQIVRAACSQFSLMYGYPLMVPTTSTLTGACELSRLFDFDSLESAFEQIGSVQSSQFAAFDFDAATRNISFAIKLSLYMMEHNLQSFVVGSKFVSSTDSARPPGEHCLQVMLAPNAQLSYPHFVLDLVVWRPDKQQLASCLFLLSLLGTRYELQSWLEVLLPQIHYLALGQLHSCKLAKSLVALIHMSLPRLLTFDDQVDVRGCIDVWCGMDDFVLTPTTSCNGIIYIMCLIIPDFMPSVIPFIFKASHVLWSLLMWAQSSRVLYVLAMALVVDVAQAAPQAAPLEDYDGPDKHFIAATLLFGGLVYTTELCARCGAQTLSACYWASDADDRGPTCDGIICLTCYALPYVCAPRPNSFTGLTDVCHRSGFNPFNGDHPLRLWRWVQPCDPQRDSRGERGIRLEMWPGRRDTVCYSRRVS